MGRHSKWMHIIAKLDPMRSCVAPSVQSEVSVNFGGRFQLGIQVRRRLELSAYFKGGTRRFWYRCGIPFFMSKLISGRYA